MTHGTNDHDRYFFNSRWDREAFQDSRTEFDSNIPDSDQGSQKAHEGSVEAMGDCPFEP
jgi:hypothetical protein